MKGEPLPRITVGVSPPVMSMLRRALIFFSISLSVLALDQSTKSLVVHNIPLNQGYSALADYVDLVHVRNSGAAFGFFQGSKGSTSRWVLTLVSVLALFGILVMTFWIEDTGMLTLTAFALFFGGAAGNLLDRIFYGEVIDFIDLHIGDIHWPAFNVADSSLCVGAALFCIHILRQKK